MLYLLLKKKVAWLMFVTIDSNQKVANVLSKAVILFCAWESAFQDNERQRKLLKIVVFHTIEALKYGDSPYFVTHITSGYLVLNSIGYFDTAW